MNSGRQIDAVNLAFAFELTEQFSPVPLLKSYLKEAKKASSSVKAGNMSPSAEVHFLISINIYLIVLVFLLDFASTIPTSKPYFCLESWLYTHAKLLNIRFFA